MNSTNRNRRRPFVKVCGQTYTGSVDCAVAYGASYIGFNFCLGIFTLIQGRNYSYLFLTTKNPCVQFPFPAHDNSLAPSSLNVSSGALPMTLYGE